MTRFLLFRCMLSLLLLFRVEHFSIAGDDQRRVVPDEKAIVETIKLVKDVYSDDLATARTSEQKVALGKKFLGLAKTSADDPTAQYVLLRQANALAVDAKNVEA